MSRITLQFDQAMLLPVDGAGLLITDDDGGTFTVIGTTFGADNTVIEYDGTWDLGEPVEGQEVVTIAYTKSAGDLESIAGMLVQNFTVVAAYIDVQVYAMAMRGFYSFDIQQTRQLPANMANAEFNNVRFRASVRTVPVGVVDWLTGDPMQWSGSEYLEWT